MEVEVVEEEDMEQPEQSDEPEKETLRMCKSLGLGVLRRELNPLRTCIVSEDVVRRRHNVCC